MGKYINVKTYRELTSSQKESYSFIKNMLDNKKRGENDWKVANFIYDYAKVTKENEVMSHVKENLKDLPKVSTNSYETIMNLIDYFNEYAELIERENPKKKLGYKASNLMKDALKGSRTLNYTIENDKDGKYHYENPYGYIADKLNESTYKPTESLYDIYREAYSEYSQRKAPKPWQFITKYRMKQEKKAIEKIENVLRSRNFKEELITNAQNNVKLTREEIRSYKKEEPGVLISKAFAIENFNGNIKKMSYDMFMKTFAPVYFDLKKYHDSYKPYDDSTKVQYEKEKEGLEYVKEFIAGHIEHKGAKDLDQKMNSYKNAKNCLEVVDEIDLLNPDREFEDEGIVLNDKIKENDGPNKTQEIVNAKDELF